MDKSACASQKVTTSTFSERKECRKGAGKGRRKERRKEKYEEGFPRELLSCWIRLLLPPSVVENPGDAEDRGDEIQEGKASPRPVI